MLLIEFSQKLKHLGKITCDQIFQYIYGYVFIPALILPYASKMLEKTSIGYKTQLTLNCFGEKLNTSTEILRIS